MTDLSGNSLDHFSFFKHKIYNNEPFAVIRPNDGEYLVMTQHDFSNIDNWHYDGKGCLSSDLKNAIRDMIGLENAYIGIPCKGCSDKIYNWYLENFSIPSNKLTYGNLFCNKNWKPFVSLFVNEKMPFNYIGPFKSNNYNLNIQNILIVDEYMVNKWDIVKDEFIETTIAWVNSETTSHTPRIFLFSIGPISKVIIPILFKKYPNNIYLDVGSSFDLFLKGNTNRGYINDNDEYTNIICNLETGHI